MLAGFPTARTTAALATLVVVAFLAYEQQPTPFAVAGWDVSRVAGTPRIDTTTINGKHGSSRLTVGQMLETDDRSQANLQAYDTGKIKVDPNTRLRLVTMAAGLKRIALDRGTIHAYIWAPAGQFVVDTPSAGRAAYIAAHDPATGAPRPHQANCSVM